ncbi:DNA-directed DNA polymerase [Aeromonas phage B614]|nr:DNA-directed DNA polymerase [Aeromonas phage B614]UYD58505.1 DNA-directed DNA polymerase [Aeromonas phage avDM14-QBC]UYD58721.1 DNA-directed DNA polymerase [Aeromonas phage avDM10-HWA]UYD58976.1 DNA-directed DNA polymerase [Aeromonas phage avDM7-IJDJ]
MELELFRDFNEVELGYLNTLSNEELQSIIAQCEKEEQKRNTNQLNRKILINSLYGALGNNWFRYFDLRNAEAITTYGQLAIRWIERKLNEYINTLVKTEGVDYVCYIDTDSVYLNMEAVVDKVGIEKFRDTNHLIDFLDNLGSKKLEPYIDESYKELEEYMNHDHHLLLMDREAIFGAPLGTDGIGGFWTGKKRYALNVYDMEGTRYAEPHLKIMGLETQRSSTPVACQKSLKESIRRLLQEGESSLQDYFKEFKEEFKTINYQDIAAVSSANNIAKNADALGFPIKGTPYHVKGALAYNRLAKTDPSIPALMEGEKVMVLPLRDRNPFNEACFAWPSGTAIPDAVAGDVLKYMDINKLFEKTFVKPLSSICEATKTDYEFRNNLFDMFDI